MKRLIVFMLGLFLFTEGLFAQREMPVLLLNLQGKAQYQSPKTTKKARLVSGACLSKQGNLTLKGKDAKATLYYDGTYKHLTAGTYKLATVFADADGSAVLDFNFHFSEYALAAMKLTANPPSGRKAWGDPIATGKTGDGWGDLKDPGGKTADGWGDVKNPTNTGDGWGDLKDPIKTADGWGGRGRQISGINPIGKTTERSLLFNWSKPAGDNTYRLKIMNTAGQVLHTETAQDTFLRVDAAALSLKPEEALVWQIIVEGSNPIESNRLIFMLSSADKQNAALDVARNSDVYKAAGPDLRALMEAVALEDDGWVMAAADKYAMAAKANPQNELVHQMHAAYWFRLGLSPLAEKAIKG